MEPRVVGERPSPSNAGQSVVSRIEQWRRLTTAAFAFVAVALVALVVSNEAVYGPRVRDAVEGTRLIRLGHEAMLDQETSLRAYVLTGDQRFLEAYEEGEKAMTELNAASAALLHGVPGTGARYLDMRLAQAAWIDGWTQDALRRGERGGAVGEDTERLLVDGKELFDEYRARFDTLADDLTSRRSEALDGQSSAIVRTAGLALLITVAMAMLSVQRGRALRKAIDPALDAVLDHLQLIRAGDLGARPLVDGPSEIRRIDDGIHEAALALARAREELDANAARLATQNRQLGQVLGLAREIAGSLNLRYVTSGVCGAASKIVDDRRVIVWLRAPDAATVVAAADSSGPELQPVDVPIVPVGEGLVGRAARFGRIEGRRGTLLARGATSGSPGSTADVEPTTADDGARSAETTADAQDADLAVPMVVGAEVIGVVQVCGGAELEASVVDVVEALAGQAATAIGAARLHEQTETMAMTDALMRLPNRRQFEHDLATEEAVSLRHDRPLAFAMVDVDHFKSYNDVHGHQAADVALQELAGVLVGTARAGDTVYRYGGEEIAILMRETTSDGAVTVAERHRAAVEHHFAAPNQPRAITVSVGVASMPEHAATAAELVQRADGALYAAKRQGRNRTCTPDLAVAD